MIRGFYLGIEKCKRRARDLLYLPGTFSGIEDFVSICERCSKYQRKKTTEKNLSSLYLDAHGLKLVQICLNFEANIISF